MDISIERLADVIWIFCWINFWTLITSYKFGTTLLTEIEYFKTFKSFSFYLITQTSWRRSKNPKHLTLPNYSINKIIYWKSCGFSSLYIFILSDLFLVFPIYIYIYIYIYMCVCVWYLNSCGLVEYTDYISAEAG